MTNLIKPSDNTASRRGRDAIASNVTDVSLELRSKGEK
jgi:hypothetical protein